MVPLSIAIALLSASPPAPTALRENLEPPSVTTLSASVGLGTSQLTIPEVAFSLPGERIALHFESSWPDSEGKPPGYLALRLGADYLRTRLAEQELRQGLGAHAGVKLYKDLSRLRLWVLTGMGLRSTWMAGKPEASKLELESLLSLGLEVLASRNFIVGTEFGIWTPLMFAEPLYGIGLHAGLHAGYRF